VQCVCAIFSSVACPATKYFSTLSHKGSDFLETFLNTKCVFLFSLQLLSETFLILRRIKSFMITNVHRLSCTVKAILSYFNETRTLTDFF
jgi:hypothetical protein